MDTPQIRGLRVVNATEGHTKLRWKNRPFTIPLEGCEWRESGSNRGQERHRRGMRSKGMLTRKEVEKCARVLPRR